MARCNTLFKLSICLLSVICNGIYGRQDSINNDLSISEADRKVDIATHLVKISTALTLENNGKSSTGFFLVPIDSSLQDYLSFFGASIKNDDEEKGTPLSVAQTTVAGQSGKQFWRVNLPSALETGKSITVNVDTTFAHALSPFPRQITQAEKQYVVFSGNLFVYSPYKIKTQSTTVTTASNTIESYTKTKPVSQTENTISYGPFENKEAFSESELRVHSENNTPFLTITSMERVIEVSHWGNIAIEEHIEIRHSGAELKGPFSRYDYQRQADQGSSVKSFKTMLPAAARDVYYRDEIGNISTSAMREMEDQVELDLRPRFPLFGGWKTKYTIGYNVPSYQYLFYSGDNYALKMRFVDHVFDDLVIDQMTFKIILPEGATNMDLKTPFNVDKGENSLHYTYLDTVGRPVIVAYKNNLVDQHIQDFELHYNFQKLRLLQEPLIVVGAFYLLFVLVIIYVRLDFSITKDEAKESKMRVSSLLEEVQSAQDKRSALYQSYDDAIDKFKAGKDQANFVSQRKKIDGDYKQLTSQIQSLQSQLKSEGSDSSDKVAELNADEWDADDFEPSAPAVVSSDKWAGEDDGDVKDSWDADDDDGEKKDENKDGSVKAVQRKKKKPLAERIAEKEAEKAARELEEKEQMRVKSKDELKAEAERLKKIQEESDLRLAKEAFGVESTGIDGMFPVTDEEYDKFRDALKQKITSFNSSKSYGPFLEKLIQDLIVDLSMDDLKKVSTTSSSLFHEKQRQQKELDKQKKKKKGKGIVTMERDTDFNDIAAAGRGDYDDAYYDEDFI